MKLLKHQIIGNAYRYVAKPIFFMFDPERVHDMMTWTGKELGQSSILRDLTRNMLAYNDTSLNQIVDGNTYKNPIGLSAGFDKDAHLWQILPKVGFGFAQIGSVTAKPYEGNPQPRLHRLPNSKGIVVYYGLKNEGVDAIINRIKKYPQSEIPQSISIAKTNCHDTSEDEAGIADYKESLTKCVAAEVGDMYTINISCPNTFGGEPFTTADRLEKLLAELDTVGHSKPVYVKMPINLIWDEFKSLVDVITQHTVKGVIIGNLQKDQSHETIKDPIPENIKGGISGKPTFDMSNNLISKTYNEYGDRLTIIGVGGIFSAEDAYEKIRRGASLVQLITGMIFEGPQLVGEINHELVQLLRADGYSNISEAVGAYHKK